MSVFRGVLKNVAGNVSPLQRYSRNFCGEQLAQQGENANFFSQSMEFVSIMGYNLFLRNLFLFWRKSRR